MKITKSIKGNKITSISVTFEDEEIGCLDDMIALSEREVLRYFEYRSTLSEILSQLKKELS